MTQPFGLRRSKMLGSPVWALIYELIAVGNQLTGLAPLRIIATPPNGRAALGLTEAGSVSIIEGNASPVWFGSSAHGAVRECFARVVPDARASFDRLEASSARRPMAGPTI